MSENDMKTCEKVNNTEDKSLDDKNFKTNTLKNVKRKIRKFTFRRKAEKKLKNENDPIDEPNDKVENNDDDNVEKSKFTLKKIFRKSSFRKIIQNIQQFTNFTVSTFFFSFIQNLNSNRMTW